jgi:hypothetical protein
MEWNWVDYLPIKSFFRIDLEVQVFEENLFSITFDNFFILLEKNMRENELWVQNCLFYINASIRLS